MVKNKILFLTLRTFSLTGGIENVCKSIAYYFNQQHQSGKVSFKMISLHDALPNEQYISRNLFTGYHGKKVAGFYHAVKAGLKQDLVILSHINLAPIGLMVKILSPNTKVVLWTHGIEVWRPINVLKKIFLKKVDQLIAVSAYTAKTLHTWHQVDPKKVKIIANALDPLYTFPLLNNTISNLQAKYALTTDAPIFMALTRIKGSEKNKNYDLVIKALAQLKKEGLPSYYFLCGKYEETEHQRLIAIANKAGFETEFIMPGFLREQEVLNLQMASNAFVLPSNKEGFGLVFMEAQAAGLRVIAGNADGSGEAVKNELAGLLINPTDIDALKNTIKRFMQNPSTIQDKQQIQSNCKSDFSYQNFAHHLAQIIN